MESSDTRAGRSNLEVSDRAVAAAVKPLRATVGCYFASLTEAEAGD